MFRTIQERVDDKLFPFKTKEKSTANSPYTSMSEDKILKNLTNQRNMLNRDCAEEQTIL